MRQWMMLAVIAVLGSGCGDALQFVNGSSGDKGYMLDGRTEGGAQVHNLSYTTNQDKQFFQNLRPAVVPNLNEAVAFTNNRPPKHVNTPWTDAEETFTVTFNNRIQIPVTVWIVKGPFDQQRQHAIEACIRTSSIWYAERMGVDFSPFEVKDATADPQAASHHAFPNGDVGDSVWAPLRTDIGFDAGRLNIYWVDTVNGLTTNGWSNFGAQVVMGRNSGDELLSHEIGHAFSLTHTDGVPASFNVENVMWSASSTRTFLTEGQLFRAHLNPGSILNAVYNARPGEITRSCGFNAGAPNCPASAKRIWADGTFPAN